MKNDFLSLSVFQAALFRTKQGILQTRSVRYSRSQYEQSTITVPNEPVVSFKPLPNVRILSDAVERSARASNF